MNDQIKMLVSELENITEILFNNGYGSWGNIIRKTIEILKNQQEQKRKWLQTIADNQLAVSPTGYETEESLAKRTGEWNGLQMAYEIISEDMPVNTEKQPHIVRCKDCNNRGTSGCPIEELCNGWIPDDYWFCADGEMKKDELSESD